MKIAEKIVGAGGVSIKFLLRTADSFVVEATYVRRPENHTVCISTQVGCVVGCRFCASGIRSRFKRSLTAAELVDECSLIAREIDLGGHPAHHITFAFMGEGEPFLNFKNVVRALRSLAAKEWPIPVHLSVSTSGVRPDLIRRLGTIALSVPLKLQVSLHGPADDIRSGIIPRTKQLRRIVNAVRCYEEACRRTVVWNYVLCEGVNDKPEHAIALAALLGGASLAAKPRVKFTRLNHFDGSPFLPSSRDRTEQFRKMLESRGIETSCSETGEGGIGSGCGQLSYHYMTTA